MSDPNPTPPAVSDGDSKTIDPVWRRRLLILDAVLIVVLGWLLLNVRAGKQAWDEAEARQRAEQDDANLRGYRGDEPGVELPD